MFQRTAGLTLALPVILAGVACRRTVSPVPLPAEMTEVRANSLVVTADPTSAAQLLSGFYGVEQESWRWTAGKFSVALKVPDPARAPQLELQFALPDVSIARLKSVTLRPSVGGVALAPQTYRTAGQHTYQAPVPLTAIRGQQLVVVEFVLDRALPAAGPGDRELGLVAASISLVNR